MRQTVNNDLIHAMPGRIGVRRWFRFVWYAGKLTFRLRLDVLLLRTYKFLCCMRIAAFYPDYREQGKRAVGGFARPNLDVDLNQ